MNRLATLNPLASILDGVRWSLGNWLALVLTGLAGMLAGSYAGLLSHTPESGQVWQALWIGTRAILDLVYGYPVLFVGFLMSAVIEVPVSLLLKILLVSTGVLYSISDTSRWRLFLAGAFFAVAAVDAAVCVHAIAVVRG